MTRLTGWLIPQIIYMQGVAESEASRLDSLRLITAILPQTMSFGTTMAWMPELRMWLS